MAVNPIGSGSCEVPQEGELCTGSSDQFSSSESSDLYECSTQSSLEADIKNSAFGVCVDSRFQTLDESAKQSQGEYDPLQGAIDAMRGRQPQTTQPEEDPLRGAIDAMRSRNPQPPPPPPSPPTQPQEDPLAGAINSFISRQPVAPPPPPEPVQPAISDRQLRRLQEKLDEFVSQDTQEKVDRMSKTKTARDLRNINSFIEELPDIQETRDIRRAVVEIQDRLEAHLISQYETEIDGVPHDNDPRVLASTLENVRTIQRHLRTLSEINSTVSDLPLEPEQLERLRARIGQYEGWLEMAQIVLETPPAPPPVQYPEQVAVTPPTQTPPTTSPPGWPLRTPDIFATPPPTQPEVVAVVRPPPPQPPTPPEPQTPPEPTRAQVRAFTGIENNNSSDDIAAMSLDKAIRNLATVMGFIEENKNDAAAAELVTKAAAIQESLSNCIFLLVLEKVNAAQESLPALTEVRDINARLRDITDLRDKVNASMLDQSRKDSLLYALTQLENSLNTRLTQLQQDAELRRIQQTAQDAVNAAEVTIEQFVEKTMKAQQASDDVVAQSQQCTGRHAFQDLRGEAVNAINAATEAKTRAQELIVTARQIVNSLPAGSRTGLAVPSIPTDDSGRIPDAMSLPTAQPAQVSQPEISGRTMTVSCDCHAEITERTPVNNDDIAMRIAQILNSRSFPETLVLIASVDIRFDEDGYVTEIKITEARSGKMDDRGISGMYFSIASAICKNLRGVSGGRRIRGIPLIIRPGGGMSFQIVND